MEMVMVWQWEIVVPCRILGRSWRKGTASWKPRSTEVRFQGHLIDGADTGIWNGRNLRK